MGQEFTQFIVTSHQISSVFFQAAFQYQSLDPAYTSFPGLVRSLLDLYHPYLSHYGTILITFRFTQDYLRSCGYWDKVVIEIIRSYVCRSIFVCMIGIQFQVIMVNQIIFLMRQSPFHRNQFENIQQTPKKLKNTRLSADSHVPPTPKPVSELKKHKRRTSNLINPKSKDHPTPSNTKTPFIPSHTTKNSINVTRANSPNKCSLANSQLLLPAPILIKNYKFYYQIGFGAFGRVWKVAERDSGRQFALKEISKSKVLQKSNLSSILNERLVLSKLTHPFLVNMHAAFQDDSNLFLAMDYLRGADLRYHICYRQKFSQKQIRFIAACLTLALEYIHSNNVIHRDIKPENILFEENGYIRLTDFGIAKFKTVENNPNRSQSSGTPVYMAPQILFKREFSFQSDFYALGVVLFQLALGKRPYAGKSRNQIREELMNKEICLSQLELSTQISPQLMNLINRLLKKNPVERLGRGGAAELKEHPFFRGVKWAKLQVKELKPPFIPNVVCETQNYLNEISLFNQMNQENKENAEIVLSPAANCQFQSYYFIREESRYAEKKVKGVIKKNRRGSQGKIQF